MKVYVLVVKQGPFDEHGEVRGVFATFKQAQSHARIWTSQGFYPDLVEQNLIGE